ncbi:hypothetical protein M9458_006768, partial [Cirrhinus mrigala]
SPPSPPQEDPGQKEEPQEETEPELQSQSEELPYLTTTEIRLRHRGETPHLCMRTQLQ